MNISELARKLPQPRGGYLPINRMDRKIIVPDDDNIIAGIQGDMDPMTEGIAVELLAMTAPGKTSLKDLKAIFAVPRLRAEAYGDYLSQVRDDTKLKRKYVKAVDADLRLMCGISNPADPEYYRAAYRVSSHARTPFRGISDASRDSAMVLSREASRARVAIGLAGGRRANYHVDIPMPDGGGLDSAECDFMSEDCIYEIKCSRRACDAKHSLQVLLYFLLARRAGMDDIKYICLVNPKLNTSWTCEPIEVLGPDKLREIYARAFLN